MSILRPTTGQLIDRLCLLTVKIVKAETAAVSSDHFRVERSEITAELEARGASAGRHGEAAAELMSLHYAMWPLVERAEAGDESVSAVELHRLNRRRAEVREEIDRLAGEFVGHEKV